MNELLEKYGDVDVAYMYDYYATRLIDEHGNYIHRVNETAIVGSIKMSQIVEQVTCRSEYEHILEIVEGKRNKPMQPVVIKESKEKYESEEQQKLRKKHKEEFGTFMSHMMSPYAYPFRKVEEMFDLSKRIDMMSHHDVKDFGMAMDNYKKRH